MQNCTITSMNSRDPILLVNPDAEPFKQWMAQVASDRLDQMQDPELDFQQAFEDYRRLGYVLNCG